VTLWALPTLIQVHNLEKVCAGNPRCNHTLLSGPEASAKFPQLFMTPAEEALWSPAGRVLVVSNIMNALSRQLDSAGVTILEDCTVQSVDRNGRVVVTEDGETWRYTTALVVAAGPWMNQVLGRCGLAPLPVAVSNEQTVEFGSKAGCEEATRWGNMPQFSWTDAGYKGRKDDGSVRYFYSVPHTDHDLGVKVGFHRQGRFLSTHEFVLPDQLRTCLHDFPHTRKTPEEAHVTTLDDWAMEQTKDFVRQHLPMVDSEAIKTHMRCLYQCTPDLQMIVGPHPDDNDVIVATGFSGSGFQFAPAVGCFVANKVAEMAGRVVGDAEVATLCHMMDAKFSPKRFSTRG